ncbi:hypothetical protein [Micavibrio aeruginosavorus]|uniref:hypothetical protein n=1 Tax=Micavibrio aeruginosavorus TaxID=349221 RepID=UPI003F4AF5A7
MSDYKKNELIAYIIKDHSLCRACARRITKKLNGDRDQYGVPLNDKRIKRILFNSECPSEIDYKDGGDNLECQSCHEIIMEHKSTRPKPPSFWGSTIKMVFYIFGGFILLIVWALYKELRSSDKNRYY